MRRFMAIYGYARVSTIDQDLAIQEAALKAAGCTVIRAEKKSGSTKQDRKELNTLLEFMRDGDSLVTEQPIDTSSAAGKAFLDMLGVFAEFETNLRRERQMEGIAAAKSRGVYKGRKPHVDVAEIRRLKSDGMGPTEIAKTLNIGRASVYRALREAASP
jgi:Site-specific recombinases, DNA invertase Pin homologs